MATAVGSTSVAIVLASALILPPALGAVPERCSSSDAMATEGHWPEPAVKGVIQTQPGQLQEKPANRARQQQPREGAPAESLQQQIDGHSIDQRPKQSAGNSDHC